MSSQWLQIQQGKFSALENNHLKIDTFILSVQADLDIRGLFIHGFGYSQMQNAKFLVKRCLFICESSIHGPKLWDVSTANNEAYLYILIFFKDYIFT